MPATTTETPRVTEDEPAFGMSLRDHFAGLAMAALVEGYDFEAREKSEVKSERTGFDDFPHPDSDATFASNMAQEAYIIADAMLRERNRK